MITKMAILINFPSVAKHQTIGQFINLLFEVKEDSLETFTES